MVDATLYADYSKALGATADVAELAMQAALGALELDGDIDAAYRALVTSYAGISAEVASEFYANQRELAALDAAYAAQPFAKADDALLAYDVANNSRASLPGLAGQRVLESADNTIYRNMRKDPAKVKWALVPHAGACAWCRLMGSNGFMYSREYGRGEGMRHANCRCTMVADFDTRNPKLDGYDDSALFKEYRQARAEVESDAQAEWSSMSAEQRAAYKAKGRGAYDHFLRNRIVARMHAN